MLAVLHFPVPAYERCDVGWVGLVGGQAGDAIGGFGSFRVAVQVGGVAVDAKRLVDAGEVQVGYVCGAADLACLAAAMAAVKGAVVRGEKTRRRRRR